MKVEGDEEVQEMLGKYNIKEPKLVCQGGRPISRMCINSTCTKRALICNELNCKKCAPDKEHDLCPSVVFNGVHSLLEKRAERQKKLIEDICKIENIFIE